MENLVNELFYSFFRRFDFFLSRIILLDFEILRKFRESFMNLENFFRSLSLSLLSRIIDFDSLKMLNFRENSWVTLGSYPSIPRVDFDQRLAKAWRGKKWWTRRLKCGKFAWEKDEKCVRMERTRKTNRMTRRKVKAQLERSARRQTIIVEQGVQAEILHPNSPITLTFAGLNRNGRTGIAWRIAWRLKI